MTKTPPQPERTVSEDLDALELEIEGARKALKNLDVTMHLELPELFGDLGIDAPTRQQAINTARLELARSLKRIERIASAHVAAQVEILDQDRVPQDAIRDATGVPASTLLRRRRARERIDQASR